MDVQSIYPVDIPGTSSVMTTSATERVKGAAASLPPVDRALFDLWITRGMDDELLAVRTGLSVGSLHTRREGIVQRLSDDLGLSSEDVEEALGELSGQTERAHPPAPMPMERAPATEVESPAAPLREAPYVSALPEPTATRPRPSPHPGQRGRARTLTLLVLLIVIGILAAVATTTSSTSPPARSRPLVGLPGGSTTVTGTVSVSGSGARRQLRLTVKGLPAATGGHYEAWLYNSVLDSQPLGVVTPGLRTQSFTLPAAAAHYAWIDVSLQPPGEVNDSGDSLLRAANPDR